MIARIVPAAILGATTAELTVNATARLLVGAVDEPAIVALVVVPAVIGLVIALVGLLATPASDRCDTCRKGR